MWMKMIAFGATASILALSACASSEGEDAEGMDSTVAEDTGEAPLAATADGQFCGGFAGFACPTGYTCQDDPNDGCDPARGGADCGGICVADRRAGEPTDARRTNPSACRRFDPNRRYVSRDERQCPAIDFVCAEGEKYFFDACGCGCIKPPPPPPPSGVPCGNTVCGEGLYCCNASCGMCVPPGMMCIQIACVDPI